MQPAAVDKHERADAHMMLSIWRPRLFTAVAAAAAAVSFALTGPMDISWQDPTQQYIQLLLQATAAAAVAATTAGPLDIFWQDPAQQGIQWASEQAKAAAEQQPWQPMDGMRINLEQLPKGAVALQQ